MAGGLRFPLGQVVATLEASKALSHYDIAAGLARHACGDWGEVGPGDWAQNDRSLELLGGVQSVYRTDSGTEFWIITDSDRLHTTVLMPDDY